MTQVSRASGVSRPTIYRGLRELLVESEEVLMVRLPGGGRKRIEEAHPTILDQLKQLIDPDTRGEPMLPLRWTCAHYSPVSSSFATTRSSDQSSASS